MEWILAKVLLRSLQRADHAIFISEYGHRFIEALTPVPLQRASVVYHGLSEHFKTAGSNKPDPPTAAAGRFGRGV